LRENEEAFLPPYSCVAVLTVQKQEAVLLKNGLAKSIKDGRLPTSSQVFISQDEDICTTLAVTLKVMKVIGVCCAG
jgi:hypothetical protein